VNRHLIRKSVITALVGCGVAGLVQAATLAGATQANALPAPPPGQPSRPTATVTLGDSIMSGEGGRLNGNPDNSYTDRSHGDPHTVYGVSWESGDTRWPSGCHRSDVSESHGATATTYQFNIACSGAATNNITTNFFKGEYPQADQLANLARAYNVKAVVLSIGANDLGWGDIADHCVKAWLNPFGRPCYTAEDPLNRSKIEPMVNGVLSAIDAIQKTMGDAGYAWGSYKFVVQGYPVPLPASSRLFYDRTAMGCPMWGTDVEWFRNTLVPRINGAIRQAVHWRTNVQYLDISKAFQGHELCNAANLRATYRPVSMQEAEWVNALNHPIDGQYSQESFHPNAYGQRALQKCLRLTLATVGNADQQCVNRPGTWTDDDGIVVSPLPAQLPGTTPGLNGNSLLSLAGTSIPADTCINATNGRSHLCFQSDGNLVIYNQYWRPIWSIGSVGTGRTCKFQWDGNLVVNGPNGNVWHSGTWGNPASQLIVQDDGNVVIYRQGPVAWNTHTNQ